ncbi:hypothetical protein KY285_030270 [Solanum tuberosum]|nr:hypothetical protein KY285_030270 [Solanum tuberosum]
MALRVVKQQDFMTNQGGYGCRIGAEFSDRIFSTLEACCLAYQENAQNIAEYLSSHPRVKKVNYAGLPDHPGRLWMQDWC